MHVLKLCFGTSILRSRASVLSSADWSRSRILITLYIYKNILHICHLKREIVTIVIGDSRTCTGTEVD